MTLGLIGNHSALAPLKNALNDSDWTVRQSAANTFVLTKAFRQFLVTRRILLELRGEIMAVLSAKSGELSQSRLTDLLLLNCLPIDSSTSKFWMRISELSETSSFGNTFDQTKIVVALAATKSQALRRTLASFQWLIAKLQSN